MYSQKRGLYCENTVCKYLSSQGYEILARNFRSSYGEIDIIASCTSVLCAVEVKSIPLSWDMEDLSLKINSEKQMRIRKTMSVYLAETEKNKYDLIRFDAAAVRGSDVTYFEGVF